MTSSGFPPVQLLSEHIDDTATWRSRPAEDPAPIVLLLHGFGSHEQDLTGLVPYLPPHFAYASLRGIYRAMQGYAWFGRGALDGTDRDPALIERSAAAVEEWIAAQSAPVVGAVGFSQGGALTLQLLRRDPRRFAFGAILSGFPHPVPHEGDSALAAVKPPVLWAHGGLDPIITPDIVERVGAFLREHTDVQEVDRPTMPHAVDGVVVQETARFLQEQWDASQARG